jgi:hypothetical protein
MNIEIRTTQDGSHTLYNFDLNENYHSIFGALDESAHVFIEAGLKPVMAQKDGIFILEVGFGTGLNAWLSLCEVQNTDKLITYIGVEPYPVPHQVAQQLNYPQLAGKEDSPLHLLYQRLHEAQWNITQTISAQTASAGGALQAVLAVRPGVLRCVCPGQAARDVGPLHPRKNL